MYKDLKRTCFIYVSQDGFGWRLDVVYTMFTRVQHVLETDREAHTPPIELSSAGIKTSV